MCALLWTLPPPSPKLTSTFSPVPLRLMPSSPITKPISQSNIIQWSRCAAARASRRLTMIGWGCTCSQRLEHITDTRIDIFTLFHIVCSLSADVRCQ